MPDTPDPGAAQFDELLTPHLDRLYRLAFRLTGRTADAEDLVQDTLIKLFRRRDELTSIRDLQPWLGRVLFNQFIDDTRAYRRQPLRLVDSDADPEALVNGTSEPGPEASAARVEDAQQLSAAVARLSEEHRVVLLLHDAEGYKLKEIQELTGTPVGTLKSRLHRARARLREMFTAEGTFSDDSTCNPMDGAKIDAV